MDESISLFATLLEKMSSLTKIDIRWCDHIEEFGEYEFE